MTGRPEAELVAEGVDLHEWGPSEGDEEAVLEGLYGQPDEYGIYHGTRHTRGKTLSMRGQPASSNPTLPALGTSSDTSNAASTTNPHFQDPERAS